MRCRLPRRGTGRPVETVADPFLDFPEPFPSIQLSNPSNHPPIHYSMFHAQSAGLRAGHFFFIFLELRQRVYSLVLIVLVVLGLCSRFWFWMKCDFRLVAIRWPGGLGGSLF